ERFERADWAAQQAAQRERIAFYDQRVAARQAYARRKWLAEPPNGWIKNVLGFRQFSLRGIDSVKAEWKLVCLALNLRRMAAMNGA
ncbi:MAG: isocitrate dehydrogenase kinase/phosphatase AceK regulatory subunit, partial [Thiomonas sp.]